jgi:hypothetical protein
MIKICPECLSHSADSAQCLTCGFPFDKKILGRFDDIVLNDAVYLFNSGHKEEAKKRITDRLAIMNEEKLNILMERIRDVEDRIRLSDEIAEKALDHFRHSNILEAYKSIVSAIDMYNSPNHQRLFKQIENSYLESQRMENGRKKYSDGMSLIKNGNNKDGIMILMAAESLNPSIPHINQTIQEEKGKYWKEIRSTLDILLESKDFENAELKMIELEPLFGYDSYYIESKTNLEKLKLKTKSRKSTIQITAIFCAAFLAISIIYLINKNQKARNEFLKAKNEGTIQSLQTFIKGNIKSKFTADANSILLELTTKDSISWSNVIKSRTRDHALIYLEQTKIFGGTHIGEAESLVDSLDWVDALKYNEADKFINYLKQHPNGNYKSMAEKILSYETTESERVQVVDYLTQFFNAIANQEFDNAMQYFGPVTEKFGSRRKISKADLRLIFEVDASTTSESRFSIDSTSLKVKKNDDRGYDVTFLADSYTTRIQESEDSRDYLTYFSNKKYAISLDKDFKIIKYNYATLSEKQIKD